VLLVKLQKRNVAMLVGYEATGYVGLHYNSNADSDNVSVADVLRQGFFKAGMILESNMHDWKRLRWSNSVNYCCCLI
jgi:tRNA U38,U39,U40 pseudouridine synthase TruA